LVAEDLKPTQNIGPIAIQKNFVLCWRDLSHHAGKSAPTALTYKHQADRTYLDIYRHTQ